MKIIEILIIAVCLSLVVSCNDDSDDNISLEDKSFIAISDETVIKNSTTINGKVSFTDSFSGEKVVVYVEDEEGNLLSDINIQFWDSDGYEFFLLEDSYSSYMPKFEIYPHNSSHWITMHVSGDEKAYDVEEISLSSEKGEAVENLWEDVSSDVYYKGRFTPKELDKADEVYLTILPLENLGKFFGFLSKINDYMGKMNKVFSVFDLDEPGFYDIYILLPKNGITTSIYWLEPVDCSEGGDRCEELEDTEDAEDSEDVEDVEDLCSGSHPEFCIDETSCMDAGGEWDGLCYSLGFCSETNPVGCSNEQSCDKIGGSWKRKNPYSDIWCQCYISSDLWHDIGWGCDN